jgi:hypothetical protein
MNIDEKNPCVYPPLWYNITMQEREMTLPTAAPSVEAMLADMLATATRNLDAQRERNALNKQEQEREQELASKKRIKEISRKILQG